MGNKLIVYGAVFIAILIFGGGFLLYYLFSKKVFLSPSGTTAVPPRITTPVVLNEVVFAASNGQFPFVELKAMNEGSLASFVLVNEKGEKYQLPDNLPSLKQREYLLVLFDGENRQDGHTLHADRKGFLNPSAGFVEVRAVDGRVLDHVRWGAMQPGGVVMGRGGVHAGLSPGTSIGRFPLSVASKNRFEWLTFSKAEVTPGAQNPTPGVEVLLPLNGALFARPDVTLTWYPVAGATAYRIQIAKDAAFQSIAKETHVQLPELAHRFEPGQYFWRVQSIFEDGTSADYSPVNSFTIAQNGFSSASAILSAAHATTIGRPLREKIVPVPLILQHKDTAMLCLESENPSGKHAWDRDHGTYDRNCKSDRWNCALASVAMVNRFKGGNLSQDRIGYENMKAIEPGPTFDLYYGNATSLDDTNELLKFAFNGSPVTRNGDAARRLEFGVPPFTPDELWDAVTDAIDAGIPLVTGIPGHVLVIVGYHQFEQAGPNARFVSVNDPALGRYLVNLNTMTDMVTAYWVVTDMSNPKRQEPGVTTDSDGDGMVDFDETERFKTDPNHPDKDGDEVKDKTEVYASVFDPNHGYIAGDGTGLDFDTDQQPMELDPDSDNGGCKDGDEDTNRNGKREQSEMYNFDRTDDDCGEPKLGGTLTISYGYVNSHAPNCTGTVNIRLKFELEPDWGTIPEAERKPVAPVYLARTGRHEISTSGCTNLVNDWMWGGADVQCNAKGDAKSGSITFSEATTSALGFWPMDPRLHIVFPQDAWLNLPLDCVSVDGRVSKSEVLHLGGEALNIGSGRNCQTSAQHEYGQGPFLLDFCVPAAPCNSTEADSNRLADCYMKPQEYAVIPFKGSLSKRGEVTPYGQGNTLQVDDIHVSWEICEGCGN